MEIKIYTDGSCLKNPNGLGAYGFIIPKIKNIINYTQIVKKSYSGTTNNKMELMAILEALEYIESYLFFNNLNIINIIIYTDSMYCVNIFTKWITTWLKNDLQNKKNKTLIKKIYNIQSKLNKKYNVIFKHVYAHTSNTDIDSINNSIIDKLVKSYAIYNLNYNQ